MPSGVEILKTDTLARVRTPPERREQLLGEFERSGMTGMQFAALVGVKYSTFAAWAAKRRRGGAQAGPPVQAVDGTAKARWLEAVIDQAQGCGVRSDSILVLQLPGGARVEMANAQQIEMAASLLRALNPALRC